MPDEAIVLSADDERRQEIAAMGLPSDLARYFIVQGLSVEDAESAADELARNGIWRSPNGSFEVHAPRVT